MNDKFVTLYWGWLGTGKSTLALEEAMKIEEPYYKDLTKWWDGYQGEKTIIIDDFDGTIPLNMLLKYLDKFKLSGEIKGGRIALNYTHVWITSNSPPDEWYYGIPTERQAAINRRINKIVYFHESGLRMDDTWKIDSRIQNSTKGAIPIPNDKWRPNGMF